MKTLIFTFVLFVSTALFPQQAMRRGPSSMGGGGGGGGGGNVFTGSTLASNQIILGAGGTNVIPLGSLGTVAQFLHGNAAGAPLWGPLDLTNDSLIGNLGVSHLNSGTGASATSTWFGDGTWKSPFPSAGIGNSTGSGWGTSYSVNGNGTKVQLFTGSSATDDCAKFDSNGNIVTAGAACSGGIGYPAVGVAVSTGSAWDTSKAAPTGLLVGTTDTQTLTNKTVNGVLPATFAFLDPTSSVQSQINLKAPSTSPTFGTGVTFSFITGTAQCLHVDSLGHLAGAGSDCGTSTMVWPAAAGIAVYTGSTAWGPSLTAPTGAIVGTTDSQTLSNKILTSPTINSGTFGTGVTFSFLTGLTQCLHVNTSGVVSGTGSDCGSGSGGIPYPSGSGIPIVVAGAAWGTTVAAPTSTIVGINDTQTLINKTVDGVSPATFAFLDPTSSVQTQLNAKVPTSRTVNAHPLTSNVVVTASDVGNSTAQWNANQINGVSLAGLTTGLLKVTGGTGVVSTAIAADLPVVKLTTGTSVTLAGPSQFFVCTASCTITVPVPAPGYQFCVYNGNNVSGTITFAAIGSSARYQNTAGTTYGTAGTGTFSSAGAVKDGACLLGLDSTHYLTVTSNGTWSTT